MGFPRRSSLKMYENASPLVSSSPSPPPTQRSIIFIICFFTLPPFNVNILDILDGYNLNQCLVESSSLFLTRFNACGGLNYSLSHWRWKVYYLRLDSTFLHSTHDNVPPPTDTNNNNTRWEPLEGWAQFARRNSVKCLALIKQEGARRNSEAIQF